MANKHNTTYMPRQNWYFQALNRSTTQSDTSLNHNQQSDVQNNHFCDSSHIPMSLDQNNISVNHIAQDSALCSVIIDTNNEYNNITEPIIEIDHPLNSPIDAAIQKQNYQSHIFNTNSNPTDYSTHSMFDSTKFNQFNSTFIDHTAQNYSHPTENMTRNDSKKSIKNDIYPQFPYPNNVFIETKTDQNYPLSNLVCSQSIFIVT
eukprot:4487_1